MTAHVIGVDSSTQSCKVLLVDAATGTVVQESTGSHPDGSQIDPQVWIDTLRETLAPLNTDQVAAVGVAAQQHGMVALDASGTPVHDALLWNDTSSAPQSRDMIAEIGETGWVDAVNVVPLPSFTLTKLAWLRTHHPELADRVTEVMLPHDWLNRALTGQSFTDASDATGTAYFDGRTGAYVPKLLQKHFGAVPALPRVVPHTEFGAEVLPEWGLGEGVGVSAGAGDNAGAALGLGLKPGEVVVSIGTSGTVFGVTPEPLRDESGTVCGFASADGLHLPLACTMNAARVFAATAATLNVSLTALDDLARAASPDADGLVFVPYLDGERTPNLPDATGSLLGLTRANMTPTAMARAAVLGVLNSLADCLDTFVALGAPVDKVLLIGGGSKSHALREAAADVFGVPVEIPAEREYVALGAARQAAWALTGECPTWVREVVETHEPSGADWGPRVREAYIAGRKTVYGV
ncbi:xylulokinase [Micrococcales bacterium 31B]|nr:xylulokinase [Micrococcales bacterium 31B]